MVDRHGSDRSWTAPSATASGCRRPSAKCEPGASARQNRRRNARARRASNRCGGERRSWPSRCGRRTRTSPRTAGTSRMPRTSRMPQMPLMPPVSRTTRRRRAPPPRPGPPTRRRTRSPLRRGRRAPVSIRWRRPWRTGTTPPRHPTLRSASCTGPPGDPHGAPDRRTSATPFARPWACSSCSSSPPPCGRAIRSSRPCCSRPSPSSRPAGRSPSHALVRGWSESSSAPSSRSGCSSSPPPLRSCR